MNSVKTREQIEFDWATVCKEGMAWIVHKLNNLKFPSPERDCCLFSYKMGRTVVLAVWVRASHGWSKD